MKKTLVKGFSLIEIMVVITIFAILGILVTGSIILTLQGTQKSESLIRARENLNYSLGVIERNIRNANSIPDCSGTASNTISYLDENGNPASFSCVNTGSDDSYVASSSARLTSSVIKITDCSFICTPPDSDNPPLVTINLSVQDASASGILGASVTASTQIYLRNY
ncbi:MAG: prepilin-type N-terminal cleavage/methylation domain-containing protein [Candidatus Microgenomates bacterium]|jgi:prepilin-type N-terminal cleavage/methylation domain-containing protein